MWVDSVRTGDSAKLAYLARCADAARYGNLKNVIGLDAGELVQRLHPPLPPAWTWRKQDSLLLLIVGTTYGAEYVFQLDGWLNPVNQFGGLVNSYHFGVGEQAYLASPNSVNLCVGHSMGGAAASMAAARYRAAGNASCFAVTFGAPRAYALGHPAIAAGDVSVQMPRDPVPWLPYDSFGGRSWRVGSDIYSAQPNGLTLEVGPMPSHVGDIADILYTYGSFYHDIGIYLKYFAGLPVPGEPPVRRTRSMPAEVFEVKIKGKLFGQHADNEFHVLPSSFDPVGATTVNEDMKAWWQQYMLHRLSSQYTVLYYQTRRIASLVWKNPLVLNEGSLWRYDKRVRTNGTSSDKGSRTSDALPSFISIGYAKTAEDYVFGETSTVLPGAKAPFGGIRLPGIVRADVEVAGNELTSAALNNWTSMGIEFRYPRVNGRDYNMVIVTNTNGGSYLMPSKTWQPTYITKPSDEALPWYAYGIVSSLALNPLVTSQVSRKQTVSRLG